MIHILIDPEEMRLLGIGGKRSAIQRRLECLAVGLRCVCLLALGGVSFFCFAAMVRDAAAIHGALGAVPYFAAAALTGVGLRQVWVRIDRRSDKARRMHALASLLLMAVPGVMYKMPITLALVGNAAVPDTAYVPVLLAHLFFLGSRLLGGNPMLVGWGDVYSILVASVSIYLFFVPAATPKDKKIAAAILLSLTLLVVSTSLGCFFYSQVHDAPLAAVPETLVPPPVIPEPAVPSFTAPVAATPSSMVPKAAAPTVLPFEGTAQDPPSQYVVSRFDSFGFMRSLIPRLPSLHDIRQRFQ